MPSSIWQQLFDAIKFRLAGVRIDLGYQTDIGTHCFPWRDLRKSTFTATEMPGFMYRDPTRTRIDATLNKHFFELDIELVAVTTANASTPPDAHARMIAADIHQVIGVDRRWGELAEDTIPVSDELNTEHLGDRIVGVISKFQIIFRTVRFDPYNK